MLDEDILAGFVALVLTMQLGHSHMALIDHQQPVAWEVIEEGVGRLALAPPVDRAGVVLNPIAVADLLHHFEVVLGPHAQPLRFQQLAVVFELGEAPLQLDLDAFDRRLHALLARGVVRGREDHQLLEGLDSLPRQWIDHGDLFDFVTEQFHPHGRLVIGRVDLDGVAANPELAPHQVHVIALVLQLDEPTQDRALVVLLAGSQDQQLGLVFLWRTQPVDRRYRGHDNRVAPGEQRRRCRVPQAVDLVVYRRVFLDVCVARGHIRLGLVVVVIGDEVLDSIVGEELLELVGELRSKRFVGRSTRVGRCTCSMVQAIVALLPEPVMPNSV